MRSVVGMSLGWALGACATLVATSAAAAALTVFESQMPDGSTVVGTQIALSPVLGSNNIATQLSKGTSGTNAGVLQNITYIQRINTKGGQDISKPCTQADIGDKATLPYQADYIFWKAM